MILLDTDVVVAHLRGVEAAGEWFRNTRLAGDKFAISVVSVAELRGGMRSAERSVITNLLTVMSWVEVNSHIAELAGDLQRQYRRSHSGIGLADYLIAATAQVNECELATLNVTHFPMFRPLQPPFPF